MGTLWLRGGKEPAASPRHSSLHLVSRTVGSPGRDPHSLGVHERGEASPQPKFPGSTHRPRVTPFHPLTTTSTLAGAAGCAICLFHQTRNLGPFHQPSSCPIPCAGLQHVPAHGGARPPPPAWASGRMVSQAPTQLFPSPTELLGNVNGKKIFNIFSDLFRMGDNLLKCQGRFLPEQL